MRKCVEQHICLELFGHVETRLLLKPLIEVLYANSCLKDYMTLIQSLADGNYHQQIFHFSYVWKEQSGSHLKLLHRCDSEMSKEILACGI